MYSGFLILCNFVLATSVLAQSSAVQVNISARLLQESVPLNQEAILEVEAAWLGTPNAIQLLPVEPPEVRNLQIVGSSSQNSIQAQGANVETVRTYRFSLRPETLGMAYIEQVTLTYHDSTAEAFSLQTPRLQIKVTPAVATAGGPRFSWPIAGGIGLLVAALGGYLWFERRRNQKALETEETVLSPAESALAVLDTEIDPGAENLVPQFTLLINTVRQFMQAHYGYTGGGSSDELLQKAEASGIDMEQQVWLRELLQAGDAVRFSGATPDPAQFHALVNKGRKWLQQIQGDAASQT